MSRLLTLMLAAVCGGVAFPAGAWTVTANPVGKTQTATTIDHAAGSTVTISELHTNIPFNGAIPPAPTGVPTFTWNLYDDDGSAGREQNGLDLNQTNATPPPGGWVFRQTKAGLTFYNGVWEYIYTGLPALSLGATDTFGQPDAFVEVVATLGGASKTYNVCTPDLPAVGQGDVGVRQPVGSPAPFSNATGLVDYPMGGFSRGFDEVSRLLSSETGTDTGIFFSVDLYEGSLPWPGGQAPGPLYLFSVAPSGEVCGDEAAGGVSANRSMSFFNMNTGDPGSGVATNEYYFVRDGDTLVEYAATGDIDATSVFYDLVDGSGRAISALSVEDTGTRGQFGPGDYIVYAYEGSAEIWFKAGPLSAPAILSANGQTFDGTAALDWGHLEGAGVPGPFVVPSDITSLSIASNVANVQPEPADRVWSDYDESFVPAFFDDFQNGAISLFSSEPPAVFEFENDGSILGGEREAHVDVANADGSGLFVQTTADRYLHDQAFDSFGRSEVVWDGTDAAVGLPGAGDLALDLEADASNTLVIHVDRIENFSGESPLGRIGAFLEFDAPGRPRSEITLPFTGPLVENAYIVLPWSLFGPDVSDIAAVGLVVDGSTTGDFYAEIGRVTTGAIATYPPIVDAFDANGVALTRGAVGSAWDSFLHTPSMTGEIEVGIEVLASEGIQIVDVATSSGLLTWSQGVNVLATGSLVWDGMDGSIATDFGSIVDLTAQGGQALALTVDSLAFGGAITGGIDVSFRLISAASPGTVFVSPVETLAAPVGSETTVVVPYANFMGSGSAPTAAELAEIASVEMLIDADSQADFTLALGALETVPVPEPGFALGLLVGIAALATSRRR